MIRVLSKAGASLTSRIAVVAAVVGWLAVVGTGMSMLTAYSNRAGEPAEPPRQVSDLPTTSPERYRLLMFVHPHCPCSSASVAELARLMSRCAAEVDATVYFYQPGDKPDDWVIGNLWNSARAIPGVRVAIDRNARQSVRFGSTVSGEVLLYDASGRLRFHGGITSARGHEGDNLGKHAVMSIVTGEGADVDHAPVFGCVFRTGS